MDAEKLSLWLRTYDKKSTMKVMRSVVQIQHDKLKAAQEEVKITQAAVDAHMMRNRQAYNEVASAFLYGELRSLPELHFTNVQNIGTVAFLPIDVFRQLVSNTPRVFVAAASRPVVSLRPGFELQRHNTMGWLVNQTNGVCMMNVLMEPGNLELKYTTNKYLPLTAAAKIAYTCCMALFLADIRYEQEPEILRLLAAAKRVLDAQPFISVVEADASPVAVPVAAASSTKAPAAKRQKKQK